MPAICVAGDRACARANKSSRKQLLSRVESVATETMTEVLRIGGELVGDLAQDEIKDARDRMAKFAPGGPGTAQVYNIPWDLGLRVEG